MDLMEFIAKFKIDFFSCGNRTLDSLPSCYRAAYRVKPRSAMCHALEWQPQRWNDLPDHASTPHRVLAGVLANAWPVSRNQKTVLVRP